MNTQLVWLIIISACVWLLADEFAGTRKLSQAALLVSGEAATE